MHKKYSVKQYTVCNSIHISDTQLTFRQYIIHIKKENQNILWSRNKYVYNNIVLSMLYAEICPKVRRHYAF